MLGTLTPASSSPCQGQTQSMPRGESESGHMRIYQSMCVELKNNLWLSDLSCQKSSSLNVVLKTIYWLPKLFHAKPSLHQN